MKIEITKNQNALLLAMNTRVLSAGEKVKIHQDVLQREQKALGDVLLCIARDNNAPADMIFERFVTAEEEGKFFLMLCEPERKAKVAE